MMTPDKDFAQLVSDKIRMFRPGRGGNPATIWGPDEVRERYGLEEPEQVIDLLGLMGDSADNIPGVPGVGEKTAIKFLQAYGSMEGLYANVDQLKGKMKEKVEANKELAFLSRELATIVVEIDFEENFPAMALESPDAELLAPVLEELEFRTLSRRILGEARPRPRGNGGGGGDHPRNGLRRRRTTEHVRCRHGRRPSRLNTGFFGRARVKYVMVSDEARSRPWSPNSPTQAALPLTPRRRGSTQWKLLLSACPSPLKRALGLRARRRRPVAFHSTHRPTALEHPDLTVVGQNLKYDGKIMARHGVDLTKAQLEDTMVAHYLWNPTNRMDALAQAFLDYQCIPITDLLGKKGKAQNRWPTSRLRRWSTTPVRRRHHASACRCAPASTRRRGLMKLFREVEMPLLSVLMNMELEGVALDTGHLKRFSQELAGQLEQLRQSIQTHAGTPFNVDSPKALGDVLFEHLAIPAKVKKTKLASTPPARRCSAN